MLDWAKIEAEYITTHVSYRQLCDKYHVSLNTLSKIAVRDKWTKKRKDANDTAAKLAVQKVVDASADRLSRLITCSSRLDELIERFLSPGEDEVAVTAKDVKEISVAVKNAIDIKRNLYGIVTEPERQQIDIARQRLELDKQRLHVDDDDGGDSGVILLPAVGGDGDGS